VIVGHSKSPKAEKNLKNLFQV